MRARRSEASFIRGGSTIFPGFRRSSGSKRRLISPKAETRRVPSIGSRNSERIQPSPCSPECEPPSSPASANASAAIARSRSTSSPSRRSSAGRTWRQPTEACAYHTAWVAWRSMTSVSRRYHSGRRSSGIAQSSIKASGLRAAGCDIEMLSPALRSAQIRPWRAGDSARATPAATPPIVDSRAESDAETRSGSSSANSTTRMSRGRR